MADHHSMPLPWASACAHAWILAIASPAPTATLDPVALATEHLVQATWALAMVTVVLAVFTLLAVGVPIVLRRWDIAREDKAARAQLIVILRLIEARLHVMMASPVISTEQLGAGVENLIDRALEADIARALPAGSTEPIYRALAASYEALIGGETARRRRFRRPSKMRRTSKRKAARRKRKAASEENKER